MADVYLNRIATAVPPNDLHQRFVDCGPMLLKSRREKSLFQRMASRSQIDHRYSVLRPHSTPGMLDDENFYQLGCFPDTGQRMALYEREAFALAKSALDGLGLAEATERVSHILVTSCTGFHAPGLDIEIMRHYGLRPSLERSIIGFMGCAAALNALKSARHIVRSEPEAVVLIVNLELCTLHFKETDDLEQTLSFLIFADGCAASLVSGRPEGLKLKSFSSTILDGTENLITWRIGSSGFDMELSGRVPGTIASTLPQHADSVLMGKPDDIRLWAVHPGGRSILDAVQKGLALDESDLATAREVLRRFGNMSSSTVMFVLADMMLPDAPSGPGCAMAFGPGLCVESMLFEKDQP